MRKPKILIYLLSLLILVGGCAPPENERKRDDGNEKKNTPTIWYILITGYKVLKKAVDKNEDKDPDEQKSGK